MVTWSHDPMVAAVMGSDSSMGDGNHKLQAVKISREICSDSSMGDGNGFAGVSPAHQAGVQIPLWAMVTW